MQDAPPSPPSSINRAALFCSPANLELVAFSCFERTGVSNKSFLQPLASLPNLLARSYNSSTKLTLPGDGDKYFHRLGYVGLNRSVGGARWLRLLGT